jgi:hypothetical protein
MADRDWVDSAELESSGYRNALRLLPPKVKARNGGRAEGTDQSIREAVTPVD